MDYYPLPNFRRQVSFPDMILCELLCQASIISDRQVKELIDRVNSHLSLVTLLCSAGYITTESVTFLRSIVSKYLNDSQNAELYINRIRNRLRSGVTASLQKAIA